MELKEMMERLYFLPAERQHFCLRVLQSAIELEERQLNKAIMKRVKVDIVA